MSASSLSPPSDSGSWLVQTGKMSPLIAAYPWENTPFGPLRDWPVHLRQIVNLALESAGPMAIIWGREFRFIYNDSYAEIIQDKHPKALGALGAEIFPEMWSSLVPLFEQAWSGTAVRLDDLELILTRNGVTEPAYFSFTYNPVRNEKGELKGFLAIVIETTVRVHQEKARAQVFDTVLSAINDFAYTFDREGRFIYINKALLDLWGLTLAEATGKNFFELNYPPELAERLQQQIQLVISGRAPVRDETRYVNPAGVEGYYEYIFSPVFGPDGAVTIVAGSTRDITSRKKLELAVQAGSQAKDDFLATLSHELRTPLNPVLLLATAAAENPDLSPEVRADFRAIADNVKLEARLIDDLLDISLITHNKLSLDLQLHEAHCLIQRSGDSLDAALKAKNLVLVKQLAAASSVVLGDEVRLQQIFWNLFRNAVKFTPEGGKITVSTRIDPARPDLLVIEFTDTGIGMTEEELTKVFNPFAQGDHNQDGTGRFGGLGLGLAISRKIVELHAGSISARSAGRDQGSTFTVELPLAAAGSEPAAADPAFRNSAVLSPKMAGLRILLVEDHAASRQAVTQLLAHRKITVIPAGTAAEALAKAKDHPFDLVISDIGLPDIDGYALMAALKATYGCRGIALSGYGTQQDIALSKEAGFLTHLTKPVQSRALFAALDQFGASHIEGW